MNESHKCNDFEVREYVKKNVRHWYIVCKGCKRKASQPFFTKPREVNK